MTAARWQAWAILVAAAVALVAAAIVRVVSVADPQRLDRSAAQARKRAQLREELKQLAPDALDDDYTVTVPAVQLRPPPSVAVVLTIAADDSVRLDGARVDAPALLLGLRDVYARDPETSVTIEADQRVVYAKVVEVMDQVHQAGLKRITFKTSGGTP